MEAALEPFARQLGALEEAGRRRRLSPAQGVDFASNDYLGLAASPELSAAAAAAMARGVPIGAGASRLLRGNDPEHEALEAEAAAAFGAEAALFFGGGFQANFALFSTLPQRGDLVVYDALIHASAHDGMRAGRADRVAAAHNDAQAFDDAITAWRASGGTGRPWIAVESLYSMDGDVAPLDDLAAVAERREAMLVIDEAHATGVWGAGGRGLGAAYEGRETVISLHTCGKALGASGALLCLPRVLADFLVNRCRPFIYATAPSPLIAAVCRESLRILSAEPERRERLQAMARRVGAAMAARGLGEATGTQIQPVIIGDPRRTMAVAAALQADGFDVRGVRPPTVPEGASRLRIALTLNASEDQAMAMLDALALALSEARADEPERRGLGASSIGSSEEARA
ncbi:MAG: 8-amino-7-oxononanoate synthase [Pseudomonadota bacterium]